MKSLAFQQAQMRRQLLAVREADAAHEAMMKSAADKAGVNLRAIRSMSIERKDRALAEMFARARAAE